MIFADIEVLIFVCKKRKCWFSLKTEKLNYMNFIFIFFNQRDSTSVINIKKFQTHIRQTKILRIKFSIMLVWLFLMAVQIPYHYYVQFFRLRFFFPLFRKRYMFLEFWVLVSFLFLFSCLRWQLVWIVFTANYPWMIRVMNPIVKFS